MRTTINKIAVFLSFFSVLNGFAQDRILLTDISIVDVTNGKILERQNVVIEGGIIKSILPATVTATKKGFLVVNGSGKYLMPGYIDSHVHLPSDDTEYDREAFFLSYLLNGITSVRVMRYDSVNEIYRDSIDRGRYLGPRLLLCQPPIVKFIGYENFDKQFEYFKKKGYHFVKYLTGLTRHQLDSVCIQLQSKSLPIAGHMHASGPGANVRNNFRSIEHVQGLIMGLKADSSGMYTLAKRMRENNVFICPTYYWYHYGWDQLDKNELYAFPELNYVPPSVLAVWKANYEQYEHTFIQAKPDQYERERKQYERDLRLFDRYLVHMNTNRVKILVGSDDQSFGVPGFSYHREIGYLKKAGLSNYEIVRATTKSAAECLDLERQIGDVKEKMNADLVILDANPLDNIESLTQISAVIKSGKVYSKAELQKKLEHRLMQLK